MPLSTDTSEYLSYSPFFAAVEGRSEAEEKLFYGRYERLSEPVRQFLLAPETAQAISSMERSGLFPDTHRVAVAKIVALVILGDILIPQIPQLLIKLGVTDAQASSTAKSLEALLAPVLAAKGDGETAGAMRAMPPLNRPTENGPRPIAGHGTPQRNILNLRKDQP